MSEWMILLIQSVSWANNNSETFWFLASMSGSESCCDLFVRNHIHFRHSPTNLKCDSSHRYNHSAKAFQWKFPVIILHWTATPPHIPRFSSQTHNNPCQCKHNRPTTCSAYVLHDYIHTRKPEAENTRTLHCPNRAVKYTYIYIHVNLHVYALWKSACNRRKYVCISIHMWTLISNRTKKQWFYQRRPQIAWKGISRFRNLLNQFKKTNFNFYKYRYWEARCKHKK